MAFRPLGTAAKKPALLSSSSSRCNSVARTATPAGAPAVKVASMDVSSSTRQNPLTSSNGQRVPVHLRGVKPPPPAPPHPMEADIAAETSAVEALEVDVATKYAASYQLYDTIVSSLETHRTQLHADKRQREVENECNRTKIAKAEARLRGLEERLQLEENQCETMRQRVEAAEDVRRGILGQVAAIRAAACERIEATEHLRRGSQSAQDQIRTMEADIIVSKQKKAQQMNGLDAIRETVAKDQADERAAVAELHQRKEHIKGIQAKIEQLRCLKRRAGGVRGGGLEKGRVA